MNISNLLYHGITHLNHPKRIPFYYYQSIYTFRQSKTESHCYYTTLGVSKDATVADIKTAYKKLAKEYHPDVNKSESQKFVLINEAYQILSDQHKRSQYNRKINIINHSNLFNKKTPSNARYYDNYARPYLRYTNKHNTHSNNGNKIFWTFLGTLVVIAYGSLFVTGRQYLTDHV